MGKDSEGLLKTQEARSKVDSGTLRIPHSQKANVCVLDWACYLSYRKNIKFDLVNHVNISNYHRLPHSQEISFY